MDQFIAYSGQWNAQYGELIKLLQALVSIIGLPIVLIQLGMLRRNIRGSTLDRVYGHYRDVCGVFVDDPSLRRYFYDKHAVPKDSEDRQKALAVSEALFGLIEHSIVQRPNMPSWSWEDCWRPYALERIRQSPIMQEYFAANKDWYTGQMRKQYKWIETDLRGEPSWLERQRRKLPFV